MSAAESIATPQCPTSPSDCGSSESRPISVGMSKATRQPAAARAEDHLVALVGLLGVAEAGELPDRPGPPAVAGRVQPAGVRVLARPADPLEAGVRRRRRAARRPARPSTPDSVVKSASRLRGAVVPALPALAPAAISSASMASSIGANLNDR